MTDLMLVVAYDEVLPRFGALTDADVTEKKPGDLVTIADRKAEERLTEGLTALLPGSVVVGEEAVHADPKALGRLGGDEPVWIVDPVDGTANFVRGDERFCMLVALAQAGKVLASWTYAPRLGLLATARQGHGALYNGRPARVPEQPPAQAGKGGKGDKARPRLRLTHPTYLDPEHDTLLERLRTPEFAVEPSTSAGIEYLDLVRGEGDAVVYTWEYPWDHAAGLLLLAEAGGVAANVDGSPFSLTGGNALPLVAAAHEDVATDLTKRLSTTVAA